LDNTNIEFALCDFRVVSPPTFISLSFSSVVPAWCVWARGFPGFPVFLAQASHVEL